MELDFVAFISDFFCDYFECGSRRSLREVRATAYPRIATDNYLTSPSPEEKCISVMYLVGI